MRKLHHTKRTRALAPCLARDAEELQRSIVFLTKENATLNERCQVCDPAGLAESCPHTLNSCRVVCQLLEAALYSSSPPEVESIVESLKAENKALKVALYEAVTTLARAAAATGGEALEAALPPFIADDSGQGGPAGQPQPGHSSQSKGPP